MFQHTEIDLYLVTTGLINEYVIIPDHEVTGRFQK